MDQVDRLQIKEGLFSDQHSFLFMSNLGFPDFKYSAKSDHSHSNSKTNRRRKKPNSHPTPDLQEDSQSQQNSTSKEASSAKDPFGNQEWLEEKLKLIKQREKLLVEGQFGISLRGETQIKRMNSTLLGHQV